MIMGQAKYILVPLLPNLVWIAAILFRAHHRLNAALYKEWFGDTYVWSPQ